MVRRLKVSNWPETTAALGRRDGRRRRFYQSTEFEASQKEPEARGRGGGDFQGAGITEAGSVCGGEETSWERSSHSQGPHKKRERGETIPAFSLLLFSSHLSSLGQTYLEGSGLKSLSSDGEGDKGRGTRCSIFFLVN